MRLCSGNRPKYYEVTFLDSWECNCDYFSKRHSECKHIIAVQMSVMVVPSLHPADYTMKMPEPRCTVNNCGSTDCKFYEARPSGVSVRYRCRMRFTHRPGLLGRYFPDGVITGAVNDVVGGKSCESAARDAKLHPDLSSEATRPIYGVAVDKIRAGCD